MNRTDTNVKTTTLIGARRRWLALAASLGLLMSVPAWANDDGQPPSGVVYVESNIGTPGGNSILAFQRDAQGNLTPLAGSPFLTGGTGVFDASLALGPFDSDQNVIANPEHTLLFAVNAGSNTIAVFHIQPDGGLVAVDGSPFPSVGINPVSVGWKDGILVVVNKDQDPNQNTNAALPNYTTFRVTPNGTLIPVPHSAVDVAAGSSPSQALTASGRVVFSTDFLGGLLESFVIQSNGRLLRNEPQTLPDSEFAGTNAPHLPLGLAVHPQLPLLYVGFTPINRVGVYQYDASGGLKFLRSVPDSGAAVCWLTVNRAGTRLYASNTGDNSISVFDLSDPAAPVEMQHLALNGMGNSFQFALDDNGQFLHVVDQRASASIPLGQGNSLHVLHVNPDGTLAEAASSPTTLALPTGTRPQGVAAF